MNHLFNRFSFIPEDLVTPEEIFNWINREADRQDPNVTYIKPLTDEEISEASIAFVKTSSKYRKEESRIKEEIDVLKKELAAEKAIVDRSLKAIEDGEITITEPGFFFKDMVNSEMVCVDSQGYIIHKRTLEDSERQLTLAAMKIHENKNQGRKGRHAAQDNDMGIEEGKTED